MSFLIIMQHTDDQIQKILELKESIIDKMTKYQELKEKTYSVMQDNGETITKNKKEQIKIKPLDLLFSF